MERPPPSQPGREADVLYNIGQQIIITVGFETETHTPADPTTATLEVEDPSGVTVATVDLDDLVRTGVGAYEYTYTIPGPAGRWHYRATATAGLTAVGEGSFHVRRSYFT